MRTPKQPLGLGPVVEAITISSLKSTAERSQGRRGMRWAWAASQRRHHCRSLRITKSAGSLETGKDPLRTTSNSTAFCPEVRCAFATPGRLDPALVDELTIVLAAELAPTA